VYGPHGERQAATIAAVRDRLGPDAAATAKRRGREMSGEQVVHFALDEIQTALRERAAIPA
jgi:hypothetical protein